MATVRGKLKLLYDTLRSDDADCLTLPSLLVLIKDIEKRLCLLEEAGKPTKFA